MVTKGPWIRRDTEGYAEIIPFERKGLHAIALVAEPEDADLISAAPELRDALAELFAIVKGECPRLLDESRGGDSCLFFRIINSIKKSEGKIKNGN